MRSETRLYGWLAGLFAAIATLGLGATAASAQADECHGKHTLVEVTIDYTAPGSIAVSPDPVTIQENESQGNSARVCWQVTGLDPEHTLHIGGKTEDDDHFPSLDRSVKHPRSFLNSGLPSRHGTFTYELWVTDAAGGTVITKDPEVIIRPGG